MAGIFENDKGVVSMGVVITVSILAILFTWLESQNKMSNGMKWGFVLLTVIAALHYDYGSDYMGYYYEYLYSYANTFSISQIVKDEMGRNSEFGWFLLYKLFSFAGKNGFFLLVAAISIFQNVVYYRFIRQYVDSNWWVLGVAIYTMSTSFYLMNFSMLRQGLAVAFFILAFPLIENKKPLIPILLVLVSMTIHKSAVILLPFVFWGFLPVKLNKSYTYIFIAIFFILFLNKELLENVMAIFMQSEDLSMYGDIYESDKKDIHYGFGFFANIIPFLLSLLYIWNSGEDDKTKYLIMLSLLGTMVIPFQEVIPLVGRIGIYYSAFSISAIPIVYSKIPNRAVQIGVMSILVFMLVYQYIGFFNNPLWIKFRVYHTIFSAI